jgi:hypothetical protein
MVVPIELPLRPLLFSYLFMGAGAASATEAHRFLLVLSVWTGL